jgi:hypothetical protein
MTYAILADAAVGLERVERISSELDAALDLMVDSSDRWLDVPFAYTEPDDGWGERFEMQCSFCGSTFWPLFWSDQVYNIERGWLRLPFYYQAGYWFGNTGIGHHFPICSDACYDALRRRLEKRRLHTAAQMELIGRARRLIRECRATVRRIKHEKRA